MAMMAYRASEQPHPPLLLLLKHRPARLFLGGRMSLRFPEAHALRLQGGGRRTLERVVEFLVERVRMIMVPVVPQSHFDKQTAALDQFPSGSLHKIENRTELLKQQRLWTHHRRRPRRERLQGFKPNYPLLPVRREIFLFPPVSGFVGTRA